MMVMCCLVLQGVMGSHDNCTWTSGVCSVCVCQFVCEHVDNMLYSTLESNHAAVKLFGSATISN